MENRDLLGDAVAKDLGKPRMEFTLELVASVAELDHILENLEDWMKDEQVSTPPTLQIATS